MSTSHHEGLFLSSSTAKLVVERRVDVRQRERVPADLRTQERRRPTHLRFWHERLRCLVATKVKLDRVHPALRNAQALSDLVNCYALTGARVDDRVILRLVGEIYVFENPLDRDGACRVEAGASLGRKSHLVFLSVQGLPGWSEQRRYGG